MLNREKKSQSCYTPKSQNSSKNAASPELRNKNVSNSSAPAKFARKNKHLYSPGQSTLRRGKRVSARVNSPPTPKFGVEPDSFIFYSTPSETQPLVSKPERQKKESRGGKNLALKPQHKNQLRRERWCLSSELPSNILSRWYRVPLGVRDINFFQNMSRFKSLRVSVFQNHNVEGQPVRVLQLGFDSEHKASLDEFSRASHLKTASGALIFSLEDDELDENGNFLPTVEKRLVIAGISPNLMKTPQCMAESFKNYIEFFNVTRVRYAMSDGRFNGKISMKIKNFIKVPPRFFYLKLPGGSTLAVRTESHGYDKSVAGPIVEKSKVECFCCKGQHLAKNCPIKNGRKFKWPCSVCEADNLGCTVGACKRAVAFEQFNRPTTAELKRLGSTNQTLSHFNAKNFYANLKPPPPTTQIKGKTPTTSELERWEATKENLWKGVLGSPDPKVAMEWLQRIVPLTKGCGKDMNFKWTEICSNLDVKAQNNLDVTYV